MQLVFDKIAMDAQTAKENRYVTSIDGIQNVDDLRVVMKKTLEVLDSLDKRVKTLESKIIV